MAQLLPNRIRLYGKIMDISKVLDIMHSKELPLGAGMTDEAFLAELTAIVPNHWNYVATGQAAKIFNLRVKYEQLKDAPNYKDMSVRLKKRAETLIPLGPEEHLELFGNVFTRLNWFWLPDVLEIQLTRWPHHVEYEQDAPADVQEAEDEEDETSAHARRLLAALNSANGV